MCSNVKKERKKHKHKPQIVNICIINVFLRPDLSNYMQMSRWSLALSSFIFEVKFCSLIKNVSLCLIELIARALFIAWQWLLWRHYEDNIKLHSFNWTAVHFLCKQMYGQIHASLYSWSKKCPMKKNVKNAFYWFPLLSGTVLTSCIDTISKV